MSDRVNHPKHYASHASGIECITLAEHLGFNLGNAFKYVWRAGLKADDPREDLQKALWYLRRSESTPPPLAAIPDSVFDAMARVHDAERDLRVAHALQSIFDHAMFALPGQSAIFPIRAVEALLRAATTLVFEQEH